MSSHRPKTAALLAYDEKLLSEQGRGRVERHLETCRVCAEELASIRLYERISGEIRVADIPTPDWSRMELPLRRAAKKQSRRPDGPRTAVWVAAALAAAAAALILLMPSGDGEVADARSISPTPELEAMAPVTEREPIVGQVMALRGSAHTSRGGDREAAQVGTEILETMRVTAEGASEAHLRFYEGTGVIMGARTEIELMRLRRGQVSLSLESGEVTSRVAKLEEGDAYDVVAGPWRVTVRGTHFRVRRDAEDVEVEVEEGVVDVLDEDGALIRTIRAPGQWHSSGRTLSRRALPLPRALDLRASQWPILTLHDLDPTVPEWVVDGTAFGPAGRMEMRVPTGSHRVEGRPLEGGPVFHTVDVPLGGAVVEGASLAPQAPPVRQGHLAPQMIAATVRAGMRRLQQCHERTARRGEAPSGRFALRITIGRTGNVQRARLLARGGSAPEGFEACILDEARSWSFPAPTGGIVTFEQPLRFATRNP